MASDNICTEYKNLTQWENWSPGEGSENKRLGPRFPNFLLEFLQLPPVDLDLGHFLLFRQGPRDASPVRINLAGVSKDQCCFRYSLPAASSRHIFSQVIISDRNIWPTYNSTNTHIWRLPHQLWGHHKQPVWEYLFLTWLNDNFAEGSLGC